MTTLILAGSSGVNVTLNVGGPGAPPTTTATTVARVTVGSDSTPGPHTTLPFTGAAVGAEVGAAGMLLLVGVAFVAVVKRGGRSRTQPALVPVRVREARRRYSRPE